MSERAEKTIFIGICTECNCPTIQGDRPDKHSNPTTCRMNIRSTRNRQGIEGLPGQGQNHGSNQAAWESAKGGDMYVDNAHKNGTVQEDGKYEEGDPEILDPTPDDGDGLGD